MRQTLPPKKYFPHDISYRKKTSKGSRGNSEFGEGILIENVRFDLSFKFNNTDVNSTEESPNALVSILKKYSSPLPFFDLGDQIEFQNQNYIVVAVIPLILDNADPFGFELEVV
ncbi:hypothetical protein A5886_001807 [Enterococcus sp. 8G7_MSG3316]|uniref:Minor capsid protein n=1 Tax=Candidatus Enterococcus testudinis TaxID=1834191 RepID=A0A242A6R7_9ENTE|nr:putative minor capsid protein [Enterococcus sp. 8G7_MSG3316]OTN76728.1 hypothetical protein A5886_001807 [Enterococcus sp. 8G7_MSG3316]